MPKSHPPYPPEFRQRMVELVRAGRNPEELAREFEPSSQTIRNWAVFSHECSDVEVEQPDTIFRIIKRIG